jgi:hypothetical protein
MHNNVRDVQIKIIWRLVIKLTRLPVPKTEYHDQTYIVFRHKLLLY